MKNPRLAVSLQSSCWAYVCAIAPSWKFKCYIGMECLLVVWLREISLLYFPEGIFLIPKMNSFSSSHFLK